MLLQEKGRNTEKYSRFFLAELLLQVLLLGRLNFYLATEYQFSVIPLIKHGNLQTVRNNFSLLVFSVLVAAWSHVFSIENIRLSTLLLSRSSTTIWLNLSNKWQWCFRFLSSWIFFYSRKFKNIFEKLPSLNLNF